MLESVPQQHSGGERTGHLKKKPYILQLVIVVFGAIMRILSLAFLSAVTAFAPATKTSFRRISSLKMGKSQEELKKEVGHMAVDDFVKSGMVVGFGSGSIVHSAIERLAEKRKSGESYKWVAVPGRIEEQVRSYVNNERSLFTISRIDVVIIGADEVDPGSNFVKGDGGALVREKMVTNIAEKFIVVGK